MIYLIVFDAILIPCVFVEARVTNAEAGAFVVVVIDWSY